MLERQPILQITLVAVVATTMVLAQATTPPLCSGCNKQIGLIGLLLGHGEQCCASGGQPDGQPSRASEQDQPAPCSHCHPQSPTPVHQDGPPVKVPQPAPQDGCHCPKTLGIGSGPTAEAVVVNTDPTKHLTVGLGVATIGTRAADVHQVVPRRAHGPPKSAARPSTSVLLCVWRN